MINKILIYADTYALNFEKVAYIRKRKNKWVVLSEKGKVLGSYDTKAQAVKRLKQIEFWKHHPKKRKKSASQEEPTYSSIMRQLTKDNDPETMKEFQAVFKKVFDQEYSNGADKPEEIALVAAKKILEKKKAELNMMLKTAAAAIDLGDAKTAGVYLANLVRWMLTRISPQRRSHSIEAMRRKIYYLNEYEIARKRTPPSSSMGQSLTLLKHLLLGHSAPYIRAVLNEIAHNL